MTKTKLYTEMTELLSKFEADFKSKKQFEAFKNGIDNLIKPKAGGGIVQFPMQTIDDINYHYCRYTEFYLPESEMVMSKEKSKGYSKKAIAKWTKAGKEAQALNDEAMKLLLSGDTEAGKIKANEAEDLKQLRNKAKYYDDVREAYEAIKLETK